MRPIKFSKPLWCGKPEETLDRIGLIHAYTALAHCSEHARIINLSRYDLFTM